MSAPPYLTEYLKGVKNTPIATSEIMFKENYRKYIFVASGKAGYIASDFPLSVFKVHGKEIKFMPLNRKMCILLCEGNTGVKYKNSAAIKKVSEDIVKYINYRLYVTCKKVTIYKEHSIRNIMSEYCPEDEIESIIQ